MQPFRYHVFVCDQEKPEGLSCCSAHGSQGVLEALRREVAARNLFNSVAITPCGSLGMCDHGPIMVIYPEGVWYARVSAADVPELVSEHFQHGRPLMRLALNDEAVVKQEIGVNRGKALAMLKARDEAGALPENLDAMVRGYMASRITLTAVELDLFTHVARIAGQVTAAALANAMATDARATEALANALVALGLLNKTEGSYANAVNASRFLVDSSPDNASLALKHNLSLWDSWSQLTNVVRSGKAVPRPPMEERGDEWTAPFIAAMHRNAALRAPAVVAAVGAANARRLIDIGGGSGAYAIAFAKANERLMAEVFDLPSVVGLAVKHIAQANLSERVVTRAGDLCKDSFGSGYDLALLSAICHMLGPDENSDLFRRVFAALAPGGQLVVQDFVMNDAKTAPRAGALFAINMLVGTSHGSSYSESEYVSWLRGAGFAETRSVPIGGPNQLIIARKR